MLEIHPEEAVIVVCVGKPAALDGVPAGFVSVLRIAPDEAWIVGPRSRRPELLAAATEWLASADPTGLVADQTDGWAMWSARGEHAAQLFGRLSVSPMPGVRPALVQGALSGVPGKVVLTEAGAYYLVPAPVGHHLRDRIVDACEDLAVRIGSPRPFTAVIGRLRGTGGEVRP